MLHSKYRARFLKLADLFLKSSHLPSYLVAAFVKRMARLALFAPPAAILAILPMVHNLVQRHTSCLVLLHRGLDELQETVAAATATADAAAATTDQDKHHHHKVLLLLRDPYRFDEPNPAHCRALESSLWELEALKEHYFGTIASFVRGFRKPIDNKKIPYVVEDFLENTYPSVRF